MRRLEAQSQLELQLASAVVTGQGLVLNFIGRRNQVAVACNLVAVCQLDQYAVGSAQEALAAAKGKSMT